MRARMLQCLRKATAQLKIITKKTQHLSLPLQKCSLASKQYSTDLFRQYFSTRFSTSVACHVEHVIGPWKSSPAKRPGITSHYCARMQNSGDDYRSSRIFNSCPGPEGLGRSNKNAWSHASATNKQRLEENFRLQAGSQVGSITSRCSRECGNRTLRREQMHSRPRSRRFIWSFLKTSTLGMRD